MHRRSGKTACIVTVALGAGALAAAALALRPLVVEEWHLRRLESSEPAEQVEAARRLGEMRSQRAVSRLIAHLEAGLPGIGRDGSQVPLSDEAALSLESAALVALARIGEPAVTALLEAQSSWSSESCLGFAQVALDIGEAGRPLAPVLEVLLESMRLDFLGTNIPVAAFEGLDGLERGFASRVAFLLRATRNPRPHVAERAIARLCDEPLAQEDVLPALRRLADPSERVDPSIRGAALAGIVKRKAEPGEDLRQHP